MKQQTTTLFFTTAFIAIALTIGIYLMTGQQPSAEQFGVASTNIQIRQEYILGKPPRLAPLEAEQRSLEQQQALDDLGTIVVDGERKPRSDIEALRILIHHPQLYKAHVGVAQKFLSDGEMSIRDRELAILRIGWLSQAPFEWGAHVKIARRNGVSAEEIERVMEGSSATGWSDHDRALVRSMEELHLDSMITDETWATLAQSYNEKQLIELILLAGQYKTVAYLQNSLRLPLPPGNKGLEER